MNKLKVSGKTLESIEDKIADLWLEIGRQIHKTEGIKNNWGIHQLIKRLERLVFEEAKNERIT